MEENSNCDKYVINCSEIKQEKQAGEIVKAHPFLALHM
jgi:hypothetical protein